MLVVNRAACFKEKIIGVGDGIRVGLLKLFDEDNNELNLLSDKLILLKNLIFSRKSLLEDELIQNHTAF